VCVKLPHELFLEGLVMQFIPPKNQQLPRLISDKKYWGRIFWGLSTILALISLTTANPLETAFSCFLWPMLFGLLWCPGEPPVLLFAASFQAIQVVMPVLTANVAGKTLQQILNGPELSWAFYLGSLAILALAHGMKLGVGSRSFVNLAKVESSSYLLQPQRLAIAYAITFGISTSIGFFAFIQPGLTQFLLPIASLRWFVIFLVTWGSFRQKKLRGLAIIITLLEIVIGMTGFFSGFKTVLFLILVVYGASNPQIGRLLRPQILLIVFFVFGLTIYWQTVKVEYRSFVNNGTNEQVVNVSLSERLAFHSQSVGKLNTENIGSGLESGLSRLGYLEFFARSIRTVPSKVPHQDGKLWFEILPHVTMPRFLFPNKPVINDSDRTNQFTGIRVAGASQGTSISIGYVGESYIDFGVPGMFLPILFLGWFWGWIYRWLATRGSHPLLGLAAATTLLLSLAILFESSNLKIVGGGSSAVLMYWLFLRFGSDSAWYWLTGISIQRRRSMQR
jgi:hypothetical protein